MNKKHLVSLIFSALAIICALAVTVGLVCCRNAEDEGSLPAVEQSQSEENETAAEADTDTAQDVSYEDVTDENGSVVTDENGNNITVAVSTGEAGVIQSEDSPITPPSAGIGDTGEAPSEPHSTPSADSSASMTDGSGDIIGTVTLPPAE